MSNQVALFVQGGALAVPEHLRGIEVDEQTRQLAGGAGGLRISIKGGVFRLLNNGEEIARNDDRAMNIVIVRSSPDTSRNYYAGEYVEGEAMPPTCWSTNGIMPEPEVKEKQAASCATCPMNVAGSGQGDSRACRFSRNLAVVLDGDIGGKIYKLQLPAMSLFGKPENGVMPLQSYGKLLVQHNLPVNAVTTEIRFDTTAATPKLGFKAARYLSEEEFAIARKQGETPEAIEATKTTTFQQDTGTPAALGIAGKPAVAAVEDAKSVVIEQPAVTAATTPAAAPKRTRARSNTPPAVSTGAEPQLASDAPSPEPSNVHVMTEKAEGFTYEEYKAQGWVDEDLISEGLMEAPKPPAPKAAPKPPAPKAAPKPPTKAAAAAATPAPVVVADLTKAAAGTEIQNVANLLANWDTEEE